METEQKTEKFNASLDNIKSVLELKKQVLFNIIHGRYEESGRILLVWNYDVIAWLYNNNEEDQAKELKNYAERYRNISSANASNKTTMVSKLVEDWYEIILKHSYKIWFSKLEESEFAYGLAV